MKNINIIKLGLFIGVFMVLFGYNCYAQDELDITIDDNYVTISGQISGAGGKDIVLIETLKENEADKITPETLNLMTNVDQTIANSEGRFVIRHKSKDKSKIVTRETYTVNINVSGMSTILKGEYTYVPLTEKNEMLEFFNTKSSSQIKEYLQNPNNKEVILSTGLLLDTYFSNEFTESNRSTLCEFVVAERQTAIFTLESLKKCFNDGLIVTIINFTNDVSSALSKYSENLSLTLKDGTTYNNCDIKLREFIQATIKNKMPISNSSDLSKAVLIADGLYQVNNGTYAKVTEIISNYSNILGIDKNIRYTYYVQLKDQTAINYIAKQILLSTSFPFNSETSLVTAFENAVTGWINSQNNNSSGSSGGSGGGGGGKINSQINIPLNVPEKQKFTDIDSVEWAKESITKLSELGIINGVGDELFNPHGLVTREQFIKMLVLAFDLLDENAVSTFSDVKENQWYTVYVASAQKSNITQGINENIFGIGTFVSRQDMAVMTYRVAEKLGLVLKDGEKIIFSDESEISEYAKKSVKKMSEAEIINGVGENMFAPQNTATRAQAAKIIYGIISNF